MNYVHASVKKSFHNSTAIQFIIRTLMHKPKKKFTPAWHTLKTFFLYAQVVMLSLLLFPGEFAHTHTRVRNLAGLSQLLYCTLLYARDFISLPQFLHTEIFSGCALRVSRFFAFYTFRQCFLRNILMHLLTLSRGRGLIREGERAAFSLCSS